MINFNKAPGQKILELGGGANRHPQTDVNLDVRKVPGVDIVASLEENLPIQSEQFDCVLSIFALEHVSFRKVSHLLKEALRVTKPGGKALFIIPNTEEQIKWILAHPEGWDGDDFFWSASQKLFGANDYPENTHRAYFSPEIATKLFTDAGYINVITTAFGARQTDMVVEASRPLTNDPSKQELVPTTTAPKKAVVAVPSKLPEIAKRFGWRYYNKERYLPYQDYPYYYTTTQRVLERNPASVLDIGCGRGYVVRRLQDAGVPATGIDVSTHCFLTRAADPLLVYDLNNTPWPVGKQEFDLIFGIAVLEHLEEERIDDIIREMKRVGKRGLFGIDYNARVQDDPTRTLMRPPQWWQKLFQSHEFPVELFDKAQLEAGDLPESYLKGDGKLKVAVGVGTVMAYHGWINTDIADNHAWANANHFRYQRLDARSGLPFQTGTVRLISHNHFLEHLSIQEAQGFLRDARRAIHPNGVMRIAVPDARSLSKRYLDRKLNDFDELSETVAAAPSQSAKLWELLHTGHQTAFDMDSLCAILEECGWHPHPTTFRQSVTGEPGQQILHEVLDMLPECSIYCEATPKVV